jgi:hypothetical protein
MIFKPAIISLLGFECKKQRFVTFWQSTAKKPGSL